MRTARRDILVGAAIGLGMTARAATEGGADFLLVLNAGRLRVMGAPSLAAMLPITDSNAFTDNFARREILDRVRIPVFFGAAACDPRLDLQRFVAGLRAAGYQGVANFPTAIHFDGALRHAMEAAGLGFGREVALLAEARSQGLATLGYAKTRAEAEAMVEAGVERLVLNFGWNAGGSLGVPGGVPLEEAAERARRVFAMVRRRAPTTRCLVEGGPIVDPTHMLQVCDASRADGYVGGSTLDRLPLELSVMQSTSAFKTAPLLRPGAPEPTALPLGLVGRSPAALALAARIARLVATDLPVVVEGEPGSGRTTVSRALHAAGGRSGSPSFLDARDEIEAALFAEAPRGLLAGRGTSVVIENADALPPKLRVRLADWIEQGVFDRFSRPSDRAPRARLILTHPPGAQGLARALSAQRLTLPPLRERLEDIPPLARAMLRQRGRAATPVEPQALRLLMAQPWPGNLRELHEVLLRAAAETRDGRVTAAHLEAALGPAPVAPPQGAADERAWILDALRRHRFRRGETAAFLGIARKTLYNRMRRLGLSV
ncbi:phosphoenolpyruvate hydrolase family protein [Sabulicella glaciei]|uniref:Phosphoenolpyruvate hydrolase family protein n=1 Tax=Sabulicella glaciei TaxID=2984948 RepID=A0ABT3NPS8_9PROT|nr:phosphoenolpyruvate hydrolase family protein [Roseococcus sp. MDT2-1-1]MCW8084157.1 phosphoenolpyruvate hydrolase family protein [Roseococcus sp. MDT2-1-1]